jgi:hypothetical protein
MALIAEDARHRAEQLLAITKRLTDLIGEETRRIDARESPSAGPEAEEKTRLSNAYRLELSRIGQDKSLIEGAPPHLLTELRTDTAALHEALAAHETALHAVKLITEGLVQAMAEEVARSRSGGALYGSRGAMTNAVAPSAALIDRSA